MKLLPQKTERIHSLDSLRAIMMLLGIVIHSTLPYIVTEFGFIKDPNTTHISNDIIANLIHMFRMPVFFVVAGFFGAMLFYERGLLKMAKNRASRVLYPFIIFLLLLYPTLVFSWNYAGAVFAGSDNAIGEATVSFSNFLAFLPKSTWHLWFLFYLILFIISSVLMALIFKRLPNLSAKISKIFNWVLKKPITRVFIFASMTCAVYLLMGVSSIPTPNSEIFDINLFLFYFPFYMMGWVLYKSKHLLDSFKRLDWLCTILGLILFLISLAINDLKLVNVSPYQDVSKVVFQSLIVWLFIFGITGLFIRYGSKHSARMRYVSDASYWVYLVHYNLTIFISALLFRWDVHATIKFLTVMISTTIISFVTYHYFVRSSFIGKFLNGRKYTRKLSDISEAEELSNLKLTLDK